MSSRFYPRQQSAAGQPTGFDPRRFGAPLDVTDAVDFKNRFGFAEPDRLAA
jgi:hypothetical protein